MEAQCSDCGAEVPNEGSGCQALFEELCARDFSDYRYGRFHRLMVDAYCVQHPGQHCLSAKSLMAHLCGLCCAFRHGADQDVYRALQRSLNGTPEIEKPPLPAFRGVVTIADVAQALDPQSYGREVERWARWVWEAHAELYGLAGEWLRRAVAESHVSAKAGEP